MQLLHLFIEKMPIVYNDEHTEQSASLNLHALMKQNGS